MDTKILEEIGLTDGERRVYLALLDLGKSSTGAIVNKSHITSSKVYIILERLEQKGLVSHIIKNNIKYFQVASPERILDYLEEKKSEIEKNEEEVRKILPFLNSKLEESGEEQETKMFFGYQGLKTSLYEFISDLKRGDEHVVFGAKGDFSKTFENLISSFYIEKERRGVKTRIIYPKSFENAKKIYRGLKLVKMRFTKQIMPSTIAVSKNNVLIITYEKEPIQVLIKSKPIANSFSDSFEDIWKKLKN